MCIHRGWQRLRGDATNSYVSVRSGKAFTLPNHFTLDWRLWKRSHVVSLQPKASPSVY